MIDIGNFARITWNGPSWYFRFSSWLLSWQFRKPKHKNLFNNRITVLGVEVIF